MAETDLRKVLFPQLALPRRRIVTMGPSSIQFRFDGQRSERERAGLGVEHRNDSAWQFAATYRPDFAGKLVSESSAGQGRSIAWHEAMSLKLVGSSTSS